MQRLMGSRRRAAGGFSLVELLVVMFILAVVGTIVANGLVRGLQADRQAQSRIEAFEDMQIALERVSREVRAASTLLVAEEQEIQFEVLRGGGCIQFTYWVDGDDALRSLEERSTDGCTTFDVDTEQILVPRLKPESTVFGFETDEYDEDGRVPTEEVDEVRFVTISFTSTLVDQQPATVQTVVGLRNAPS